MHKKKRKKRKENTRGAGRRASLKISFYRIFLSITRGSIVEKKRKEKRKENRLIVTVSNERDAEECVARLWQLLIVTSLRVFTFPVSPRKPTSANHCCCNDEQIVCKIVREIAGRRRESSQFTPRVSCVVPSRGGRSFAKRKNKKKNCDASLKLIVISIQTALDNLCVLATRRCKISLIPGSVVSSDVRRDCVCRYMQACIM